MTDLRTHYLGLDLRSPIVASAGPHTGDPDKAVELDRAGVGAIVLPSLFEEEIVREEIELNRVLEAGAEHFAEALDYFPSVHNFAGATDRYLSLVVETKKRVEAPVIASLNAVSSGGWIKYARLIEQAGADAVELNLYRLAANPHTTAGEMEDADIRLIQDVTSALDIPLTVKLSPFYSALANFAERAVDGGAKGLVLFNRFYQPDLDVESREVVPRVELSRPWEIRLPLRWIAILRNQLGPGVSLAATSGVHSGVDVVKVLMVGADVAMMTSALLRNGRGYVKVVEEQLTGWMTEHEYDSVTQLRGSVSYAVAGDPSGFERANYTATLRSWTSPDDLTAGSPSA
jgi:dihydroorotate dehydrogenase (fumarate)